MTSAFPEMYERWREDLVHVGQYRKLFIVGCAKSGTTWLMNLLNGHPQIVARGEGSFGWRLLPILSQAFAAFNQQQKGKDPITCLRNEDLALTLRCLTDGQFARYVQESGRAAESIRIVSDKTPQHTMSMVVLAQLYPDAQFVHIVRDPRDAATSAWFHFGKTDGRSMSDYVRYFITQMWALNVGTARQSAGALGSRYFQVRYEDLHIDERGMLRKTLDFLQVDPSEVAIEACLNAGSFENRSGGRRRGQTDATNFYRSGTVGDWRNHMPIDLVEECCQSIAPLMRACGYDPACRSIAAA